MNKTAIKVLRDIVRGDYHGSQSGYPGFKVPMCGNLERRAIVQLKENGLVKVVSNRQAQLFAILPRDLPRLDRYEYTEMSIDGV